MSYQPSSSSPLVIPGLSSRRGWKNTTRVSQDSSPLIVEVDEHDCSSSSNPPDVTCSVCQQYESRYTCPRCQCSYCSVECYRNHTAEMNDEGNGSPSSACTEMFFKNRVSSILELEAKENKQSTEKMIQDHYHKLQSEEAADDIPDDQLYELLQLLEESQEGDLFDQQLIEMMPPSLRSRFQQDIRNGKIYDGVIETWHPWWRRQLVGSRDDHSERESSCLETRAKKTLDERLLIVPQFSSLCRKAPLPETLISNLLEIIHSFCWMLRLYHGIDNITSSTRGEKEMFVAVEAAQSFLQTSSVLSQDARYSSIEEVLIFASSASTKAFPDFCNAHWSILVEDCAEILTSHRMVGRALLEASDILKAATRQMKSENELENQVLITKLRHLRKKLEFYLSWSQSSMGEFGDDLKMRLMLWVHQWDSPGDDDESNFRKGEFRIPRNAPSQATKLENYDAKSSLIEVESRTL
mmetsp:Transcript_35201/g.101366  ORF Transcript_35201/g.101366 Transcript_35201/m.101366 type:complete len:467 (+) Transcript_35201:27-1427(+)